jgi:hypothetical protein
MARRDFQQGRFDHWYDRHFCELVVGATIIAAVINIVFAYLLAR